MLRVRLNEETLEASPSLLSSSRLYVRVSSTRVAPEQHMRKASVGYPGHFALDLCCVGCCSLKEKNGMWSVLIQTTSLALMFSGKHIRAPGSPGYLGCGVFQPHADPTGMTRWNLPHTVAGKVHGVPPWLNYYSKCSVLREFLAPLQATRLLLCCEKREEREM